MHIVLANIVESLCGTNGCDTGETVLGVALIICITLVIVAMVR